jgi:hypothetical protein
MEYSVDLIFDFRNSLLTKICNALQLTGTQFTAAESAYMAVGKLLGDDGRFDGLNPRIYPQGSMSLQTTVRPRGRVEYDLDLIFEIDCVEGLTPKLLYEAVRDCLRAHALYGKMLETHSRCLRLTYENEFHLDIVPARTHPNLGVPFIEIPQKPDQRGELHSWVKNNPKGFVQWFKAACNKKFILMEKAVQEPLPPPVPSHEKPVLAQAVQLLKRQRDVVFDNADDAPSSIVLTTLAGTFYQGEQFLENTLTQVLDRIGLLAESDKFFMSVINPVCNDQKLCENWTPDQCTKFADFVRTFRHKLQKLSSMQGVDEIGAALRDLFGDETLGQKDVVSKAIVEYVDETVNKARKSDQLRFTKAGALSTVAGAGIGVQRNTFYGGEE